MAGLADLDRNTLEQWCPIERYNSVCTWVEENLGRESIRKAGIAIGTRAYDNIVKQEHIDHPTPFKMMSALQWAASTMIRDPKGRGWEILDHDSRSVTMRRTQTLNCVLQEGLLLSLVQRVGVVAPMVTHDTCTRRGFEFCEYQVSWANSFYPD